jgi:Sugar kinases, ribokinase family
MHAFASCLRLLATGRVEWPSGYATRRGVVWSCWRGDGTGAGDCFDGSLTERLAAGDNLEDAVRYANSAAALSTTGHGAIAPIPKKEQVWRLLDSCRE